MRTNCTKLSNTDMSRHPNSDDIRWLSSHLEKIFFLCFIFLAFFVEGECLVAWLNL